MGVSTETVKTHLRNIRIKTGLTKMAAARAAFGHEVVPSGAAPQEPIPVAATEGKSETASGRPTLLEGTPPMGRFPNPDPPQSVSAVREERVRFEAQPLPSHIEQPYREERSRNPLTVWQRLIAMALGAILLATFISQAVPVSQAFQQLANLIVPPDR